MERRRDLRVKSDHPVRVVALDGNHNKVEGTAIDLSGRGISIFVPWELHPGDPVKIEIEDGLLLGEVRYCRPHQEGFVIGVDIDQALTGLVELGRLNQSLLGPRPSNTQQTNSSALSYSMSE